MNKPLAFSLSLLFLCGSATCGEKGSLPEEETLSREELTVALYCMDGQSSVESVKQFSGGDYFRLRYTYGVHDPATDRPNELHLAIYSKDDHSAWLYEMLLEKNPEGYLVTWVNSAQLERKRGEWRVKETLGGIYSYERVRKLANWLYKERKITTIGYPFSKPAPVTCEHQ